MIFDRFFKNNKEEDTNLPDQDKTIKTTDYYTVGVDKFGQGEYKAALEYFQAAIDEYPDRENAYLKLAETHWTIGKHKDAIADLYKLLSRYPDNKKAQTMLAQYQQPQFSEQPKKETVYEKAAVTTSDNSSNKPYDPHAELSNYMMPDAGLMNDYMSIRYPLKNILQSPEFLNTNAELPVVLGTNDNGHSLVADITEMPNLLISGMTGYGKSTLLNVMLLSLLFKKHPSELKLVVIGDKRLSLTPWEELERHYLAAIFDNNQPVIIDNSNMAFKTMNSLCVEMDLRYKLLREARVRNIKDYNHKFCQRKLNPYDGHHFMPYIVVVFYEFASVISKNKDIEMPINKLAQLAKNVGIHIIIASSRSDVDVFPTQMKSHFPARLSFKVSRGIESNAILGASGAQNLKFAGEMLYSQSGSAPIHMHGAFVSDDDIDNVIRFVGKQSGYTTFYMLPDEIEESENTDNNLDLLDPLIKDAARIVVQAQYGSPSLLQRKLKLGYNRAGRMVEQLEKMGIVGPFQGSTLRAVYIHDMITLEKLLNNY